MLTKVASNVKGLMVAVVAVAYLLSIGYHELPNVKGARVAMAMSRHAATIGEVKNAEYYGLKRAQIAMQEYQVGVYESAPGCDCGPVIDKYTEGNRAQWCTMFASWVTREAGSPMVNERTGNWRITNSRELASYLEKNGTWYSREAVLRDNLEPKVGDFIIYWRGSLVDGLGHVDIVVNNGDNTGYAETIGGNIRDKVELRTIPYRDNYGFLGFGRPEKL